MYRYEYTADTPRDFPTLGIREVKKGDVIESEEPLCSSFLKDATPKVTVKGDDK